MLNYAQKEILKKAEERVLYKNYENTCLEAGLCPECGKDLSTAHSEDHRGVPYHKCESCGFKKVKT